MCSGLQRRIFSATKCALAVQGHSRSSKVDDFGTIRKRVCDFLLVPHCVWLWSYHAAFLRYTATYWLKLPIFPIPLSFVLCSICISDYCICISTDQLIVSFGCVDRHSFVRFPDILIFLFSTYMFYQSCWWIKIIIRRPRSLCPVWNFAPKLTMMKLESWGYPPVKTAWSYSSSRFDTVPACDRRTGRQTDGRIYYSTALCIASCWRAVKILISDNLERPIRTRCSFWSQPEPPHLNEDRTILQSIRGARAPPPSTSNCLVFQVTPELHKLWYSTPCGRMPIE